MRLYNRLLIYLQGKVIVEDNDTCYILYLPLVWSWFQRSLEVPPYSSYTPLVVLPSLFITKMLTPSYQCALPTPTPDWLHFSRAPLTFLLSFKFN